MIEALVTIALWIAGATGLSAFALAAIMLFTDRWP